MAKLIKKNWHLPLILNWVALWRYYQGKTIDLMWLNTVLWHKVAQAKKFHRGNCSRACTGLETMSGLIGELTAQPFVLPVKLTSHIRSHWKWNTLNFPCSSVVSFAISMLWVAVYYGTLIWNPGWNSTRTIVYNSRIIWTLGFTQFQSQN